MRRTVLCVLALLSGLTVITRAQNVKPYEIELFAGAAYPLANLPGSEYFGVHFGVEGRYNFDRIPLDVGLEESLTMIMREGGVQTGAGEKSLHLRNWSSVVVADWNLLSGEAVSPFAGVGVGLSQRCETAPERGKYAGTAQWGPAFNLRMGVEIGRHVRIVMGSRFTAEAFNTIYFRVGYAFGGGLKEWRPRSFD